MQGNFLRTTAEAERSIGERTLQDHYKESERKKKTGGTAKAAPPLKTALERLCYWQG